MFVPTCTRRTAPKRERILGMLETAGIKKAVVSAAVVVAGHNSCVINLCRRHKNGQICGCGGTGTDTTVPTNTVQVPITAGTVTDSGSEYTGFIGVISRYIYKAGKL